MSRPKIGDAAIAVTVLFFVVAGFTMFLNEADSRAGVSSGIVGDVMNNLSSQDATRNDMESQLISKVDETETFNVEDQNQELEDRGAQSSFIINLFTKNLFVRLFKALSDNIPGSALIFGYLLAAIGIIITVVVLRFFWGDSKI